MLWVYLFIGVVADAFGVYFSKQFVDSSQWLWVGGIVVVTVILNVAYILALKEGLLSVITPIWLVALTVTSVIMGLMLFGEKLSTLQWLGVGFAVAGMVLLQWPTKG